MSVTTKLAIRYADAICRDRAGCPTIGDRALIYSAVTAFTVAVLVAEIAIIERVF